jgi:dihydropteroate synthase
MADLAARRGCALVLMHNQDGTEYAGDLLQEIKRVLREATRRAIDAGVPPERVWIDPGIGFGKTPSHNWSLLRHLEVFVGSGYPVLLGTSRKRFLGLMIAASDGRADGELAPVDDRLEASVATAVWAMVQGVRMVRVHDVRATVHAATVVAG